MAEEGDTAMDENEVWSKSVEVAAAQQAEWLRHETEVALIAWAASEATAKEMQRYVEALREINKDG